MSKTFANLMEGRKSPTINHRDRAKSVTQAYQLFRESLSGTMTTKAALEEAFSTSDFPFLLGEGFAVEARSAYREVVDETASLTYRRGVPDFRKRKMIDIFGATYFEHVAEGEEYKSDNPFEETEIEYSVEKFGRVYGLTWERFLEGDFSDLADFPGLIGRGAANTRNREVYNLLTNDGAPAAGFFNEVSTAPLTYDSLLAAKQHIGTQQLANGRPVSTNSLVLVVPTALADHARALVSAQGITETTGVGTDSQIEIQRANPLAGITVQESMEWQIQNGNSVTAWALLPSGTSLNPAVIHAYLNGYQDVDIRVKRDQGDRVGGGQLGFQDGSFEDDTIWYRGRYIIGVAQAWNQGTYASTGTDS